MTGLASADWRSLLFVPVTQQRFVDRAHTRGSDAVQLDLEDSVPVAEKTEARRRLPGAVERLTRYGADVVVRINRPWRLAMADLAAAVRPGVRALALPKVSSAEQVRVVDEVVGEHERDAGLAVGAIRLLAMVETAEGLFAARAIAAACPRLLGVTLGGEDFATSVGTTPAPDLLAAPAQAVVIAARAAGVAPYGLAGTVAGYRDESAFGELARRSRRLGFVGASAIHPRQVPILNAAFSPGADEVDAARRLVEAYAEAAGRGVGAIEYEGSMVDEPVAARARALLERHESLSKRAGAEEVHGR